MRGPRLPARARGGGADRGRARPARRRCGAGCALDRRGGGAGRGDRRRPRRGGGPATGPRHRRRPARRSAGRSLARSPRPPGVATVPLARADREPTAVRYLTQRQAGAVRFPAGTFGIDARERTVHVGGAAHSFARRTGLWSVLSALLAGPGQVVSPDQLARRAWGAAYHAVRHHNRLVVSIERAARRTRWRRDRLARRWIPPGRRGLGGARTRARTRRSRPDGARRRG